MEFQTLIDAGRLQKLLGNPKVAIIDCRFDLKDPAAGRRAYLAGHIPHARHADLDRDLAAPPGPGTGRHPLPAPDAFAAWAGSAGIGDGTQVIAYDAADGSFAARLWWLLRWAGHRAAAVLDGGLAAWIAAGGALEQGESLAAALRFTPRLEPGSVLNSAQLEAALLTPAALLVDARSPERFAGTVEPIDPVAGHIPGAVNHPFVENLGAGQRFLPAAELEMRWRKRLAGRSPAQLIAMCGSGVTACHNLLSLEVAGLGGAKLYAGSWSEWIRDPKRPVARGA